MVFHIDVTILRTKPQYYEIMKLIKSKPNPTCHHGNHFTQPHALQLQD